MNAIAHRPGMHPTTPVTAYTIERRIVGTPAEVADTVDRVRRSGRLVAMTRPRLTPDADAQVSVTVRVLAPPARSPRQITADRRPVWRRAGRVAAVMVPVTGLTAAVIYAVARLVAALIPLLPYLGGALLVALILWAALGRAGICPGLHCPGCSHGGHR